MSSAAPAPVPASDPRTTSGSGPSAVSGPGSGPVLPETVRQQISALFAQAVTDHRTAGVTWAIIGGHRHREAILAHGAAGATALRDGVPAPGARPMERATVSRIASMTKSFTAATILALRDEGRLRLDDPIAQHVPEAADAFAVSPGDAPITLRLLLTMSAGLVTDNPWGDRQESLTPAEFAEILRAGLGRVHRPGTGFEYSNTGYALLGRVIDEVTGTPYAEEIRRRFLDPLGLQATAFEAERLAERPLATGHRLGDREDATRFEPVELDSPGVYGAMAGLFSTVDDIATWVRFLAAADAAPADTAGSADMAGAVDTAGPADTAAYDALLSTASRREMQQMHRIQPVPALPAGEDGRSPGFDRIRAYGMGLVVERHPDLGEVISHSGGYPGYGSFMVWHRDSGIGVVALANSKYAPVTALSMQALRILRDQAPGLLDARPVLADARTLQAAQAALDWLRTDDPAADAATADVWFADTMELDVSRPERRRRLATALASAGLDASALTALSPEDAEVLTPAHLRWTLPGAPTAEAAGANGAGAGAGAGARAGAAPSGTGTATGAAPLQVRIDLQMDPRREALIQGLDVVAVPDRRQTR
ncbi:serine hydrolase domain-containing protein [Brachybacterium sp. DNPG3]